MFLRYDTTLVLKEDSQFVNRLTGRESCFPEINEIKYIFKDNQLSLSLDVRAYSEVLDEALTDPHWLCNYEVQIAVEGKLIRKIQILRVTSCVMVVDDKYVDIEALVEAIV